MLTAMSGPLTDGRIAAVLDDGLDPAAPLATRVQVTSMILDRLFGRPVAVSEAQPAGTQAYTELRATLATLPPGDRLSYLREARMAADVAVHTSTPALMVGEGEVVDEEEGGGGYPREA